MDLSEIFSPAIDLLKRFLGFTFTFYGVTMQVEDIFIFTGLIVMALLAFKIFKHE